MKPAPFAYETPREFDAALALLAEHGEDAAVLAGGQSLMPLLALRMTAPGRLVDINRIEALRTLDVVDGALQFGALVRHADALRAVRRHDPAHLLARALPHVAHQAIRHRGTVCGSLALADPAAELPACAVCLDAEIELASTRGVRRVAADRFFEGVYATQRAADELVVAVHIPAAAPGTRFAFDEVARRHGDYAILGLAATAQMLDGHVAAARLFYFGAGERPSEAREAAAALIGRTLDDPAAVERAGAAAAEELEIAPDATYGEAYKRRLAAALVARIVRQWSEGS
ncbi:MAG: FAD binding domain-containing protein [Pseudomonadota bacterium]